MTSAALDTPERFAFGENWSRFLRVLDEERIREAERSLQDMLGVTRLDGKRFLDIGSGSGLFSLAARRLGASVHSFDFDPQSIACTAELRRRFFPDDSAWTVQRGSVLDESFVASLGTHDVVYSWGVLHHTGAMRRALEHAARAVAPGGQLFIAIYNYQHYYSRVYTTVKRAYVRAPAPGKWLIAAAYIALQAGKGLFRDVFTLRNPLTRYSDKKRMRGMSMYHDWIDWIGGYPFEPAKPEEIFDFYRTRGFVLDRLITCGSGQGCNEFVFRRSA
ncbi:MAG TPA: class I SAM-dependent methyltransferase [Gemmatimonadaceae bacterium]|nr:class I SAM-dependent methyltransferase [Gemmatimonadaceae bacterium]